MVVCGRANYTNLSRYSSLSERTFRRNLNKGIGFESINGHLIETHGSRSGGQILVVDATFHEKSGRHTPNLDRFYNGKSGQVEKGLEWSVVAVVDLEQNTAYAFYQPSRQQRSYLNALRRQHWTIKSVKIELISIWAI